MEGVGGLCGWLARHADEVREASCESGRDEESGAMDSQLILPAVLFEEAELCRAVDGRRWRAQERNTRRGRSEIQGFGCFAVRQISRGAAVQVGMPLHGNFPVNHSERPNVGRARNRAGLFALRQIEAGEEIMEDYRFLPYFGQAIPVLPRALRQGTVREYGGLLRGKGFVLRGAASGLVGAAPVLGGGAADPFLEDL